MLDVLSRQSEYIFFSAVIVLVLYAIVRIEMIAAHLRYQQLLKDLKLEDQDDQTKRR
jgi:membrane protein YdbS with pleckstrin-like domain